MKVNLKPSIMEKLPLALSVILLASAVSGVAYVHLFSDLALSPARDRFLQVADSFLLAVASSVLGFAAISAGVRAAGTSRRVALAALGCNILMAGNYPIFGVPVSLERDVVHAQATADAFAALTQAFPRGRVVEGDVRQAVEAVARTVSSLGSVPAEGVGAP